MRASRLPTPGRTSTEHVIQLHVEKLPDGGFLATGDDVQGLIAQARTVRETLEIACDVAKKLVEAQSSTTSKTLTPANEAYDYPLIVAL